MNSLLEVNTKITFQLVLLAQAHDPNYSEGLDWRITSSRSAWLE